MPPFSPPLSSPPFFQRLDFERLRPLPPSSILLFLLLPLDLPPALQREMWRWIERREERVGRGEFCSRQSDLRNRHFRKNRDDDDFDSLDLPPLSLHIFTTSLASFLYLSIPPRPLSMYLRPLCIQPRVFLSLLHPFLPHTTSSSQSHASEKPLPAGRNTNFPLPPLSRRGLWLDPRSRRGAPLIRPRMLKPLETDQRVGKAPFPEFFGRRLFLP